MMNNTLPNSYFHNSLKLYFPLFVDVYKIAFEKHLQALALLGLPRRVERAGELHRAIRTCLRPLCDISAGMVELVEEPEGQGLDYLIFKDVASAFAVRWGRWDGKTVHRNSTTRTDQVQGQGMLFGGFDQEKEGLPVVTVAYTIEDDRTEAGIPVWWMGSLVLLRERVDEAEFIAQVEVFTKPPEKTPEEIPPPLVEPSPADLARWDETLRRIRGAA